MYDCLVIHAAMYVCVCLYVSIQTNNACLWSGLAGFFVWLGRSALLSALLTWAAGGCHDRLRAPDSTGYLQAAWVFLLRPAVLCSAELV